MSRIFRTFAVVLLLSVASIIAHPTPPAEPHTVSHRLRVVEISSKHSEREEIVKNTSMMFAAPMLFALLIPSIVSVSKLARAQESSADARRAQSPFACNRLALTPEQRKRHFDELGPKLLSLKKGVRELPNGYELEFPADAGTVQLVTEWVIGERACCPFFDIDMRLEREGGSLWLGLTGREGVKQFIQADGASWIRK